MAGPSALSLFPASRFLLGVLSPQSKPYSLPWRFISVILISGKLRQVGGKFKAGPGLFSTAVSKQSKARLGERMFAQHAEGPFFKSGIMQTRVDGLRP